MPKQGIKRISAALTNLSVRYTNSEYIASQFLKDVPVKHDIDKYYVYVADFRLPETVRANYAPANQITWEMSISSYTLQKHSLKDSISDDDRDNTDAPIDLDVDTTEFLTDKIQLREEYEAAKLLFTTTTFSNNASLTTQSSWKYNTSTSAPIQNVLSATGAIIRNSGIRPNTAVMGFGVLEALKENPNVYGRIQYTDRAIITEDLLAALFDLKKVYVGTAVYDTSKEGEASNITPVWGNHCLIAYFNPNPGHKKITTAIMLRSTSYGSPYVVKKWYDENTDCDWIEVTTKFTPKAVATACAYLFKGVA